MWIRELLIENIRLIERLRLLPERGINVIAGPNGAGKTSVLEAIYLAGRGRTFRHREARPLIRDGKSEARVLVRMQETAEGDRISTLGLARQSQGMQCRLDGSEVRKRSMLAGALPVQWVNSQPQIFLEGGPDIRRRFLDMTVFHVKHTYVDALSDYQRALKQRNAALRGGDAAACGVWHQGLSDTAEVLDHSRRGLFDQIRSRAVRVLEGWETGYSVEFVYRRGWSETATLGDELNARLREDMKQGYTGRGPHRAEIEVLAVEAGRRSPAVKILSRGQLKMLVFAINLAAFDVIVASPAGRRPIWLVDDVAAELDSDNREKIMGALAARDAQAFITRLSDERLPSDRVDAVFHVEQGELI